MAGGGGGCSYGSSYSAGGKGGGLTGGTGAQADITTGTFMSQTYIYSSRFILYEELHVLY